VLSKNLPEAEATLKRAAAGRNPDPRVRGNLALVVGLQGRFDEAETIARADLPPDQAAANVAYLRKMIAQQQNATPARSQPRRGGIGGPAVGVGGGRPAS
jgi:Flp pilus assembly protein TadD